MWRAHTPPPRAASPQHDARACSRKRLHKHGTNTHVVLQFEVPVGLEVGLVENLARVQLQEKVLCGDAHFVLLVLEACLLEDPALAALVVEDLVLGELVPEELVLEDLALEEPRPR